MAPEPVKVVNDDGQTAAATTPPTYLESSAHIAPIPVPHTASVPESFQEAAWSSAPQFQHSIFWQNSMNTVETVNLHQQDIQNDFYLGSTDGDVIMEFGDETAMEPPVYSIPTMWTSSQLQNENQTFYSNLDRVVNNINEHGYQTYFTNDIQANWASVVSIHSSVDL
jgi:hypothetical protein